MGSRLAALVLCGLLCARPAPASPALGDGDEDVVAGVELHLPAGVDASGLAKLVAVRRGQVLLARNVRRTLERLYATGRFSSAVARVQRGPEGVVLVFELSPRRALRRINVAGAQVFQPDQVRARAGLSEREEFVPERLEAAVAGVKEAYRRRGYDGAKVEAEVSESGDGRVDVSLRVEEGTATRVRAVAFHGGPGLPLGALEAALGVYPGDVLDEEALAAGLERLKATYRQSAHHRARVGELQVERDGRGGARVTLPVEAGPRWSFGFRGNRGVPDAVLRGVLRYDGSELLDEAVEARLARRAEAFYRFRGYQDARVTVREVVGPGGAEALLLFDVDEGPITRVAGLRFEGNHGIPEAQLRAVLVEAVRGSAPAPADLAGLLDAELIPGPPPAEIFVEPAWRLAAEEMEGLYRELGYLRATVRLEGGEVRPEAGTAAFTFRVDEGPQACVRALRAEGWPAEVPFPGAAPLREGAPLAPSELERARGGLSRALGREGYLFSRVEVVTRLSADGREATVLFPVVPGPRVKVGNVIVKGLQRTRPWLVRDNLRFKEGDVVNPEALYESQRAISSLGTFRSVAVSLLSPEVPEPVKDVVVEVKERPQLEGDIAGGYFLVDGPRVLGTASYPNIGGAGLNANLRGKLNYVGASVMAFSGLVDPSTVQGLDGLGGRGNGSVSAPRGLGPLPDDVSARVDLLGEREFRPSYRFTRFAAVAGLEWVPSRWFAGSLQYELETNRVAAAPGLQLILSSLSRANEQRLRFPIGLTNLQSLRPAFTLDFRDDPANPRSGVLLTGMTELTRDLGAQLTDAAGNPLSDFRVFTLKVQGAVSGYLPLWDRVVLAASVRGGRFLLLDPTSATIGPKRFFLGGGTSLRGFREDGVLPADRRAALHEDRASCSATANPAGCTPAATVLASGREVPSEGGEVFTLGKVELRFPFPSVPSLDTAVFLEAGNLWLQQASYRPL
ncbi:MAG: BamA/TamA family outer membrane protein, partial [Deltaproteobacteria bacterium]|nr:BamA/TamA family outer membrane protein [Deltaproteobacteria bacterium]